MPPTLTQATCTLLPKYGPRVPYTHHRNLLYCIVLHQFLYTHLTYVSHQTDTPNMARTHRRTPSATRHLTRMHYPQSYLSALIHGTALYCTEPLHTGPYYLKHIQLPNRHRFSPNYTASTHPKTNHPSQKTYRTVLYSTKSGVHTSPPSLSTTHKISKARTQPFYFIHNKALPPITTQHPVLHQFKTDSLYTIPIHVLYSTKQSPPKKTVPIHATALHYTNKQHPIPT